MTLQVALGRIRDLNDESIRVSSLNAGSTPSDDPKNSPAKIFGAQKIAGLDLNYQLGVLLAGKDTRAYSAGILSGGLAAVSSKNILPGLADKIIDVAGAVVPSAVANSQHHYGSEVNIQIENQPLWRGSSPTAAMAESWKWWGAKLLFPNYDQNDFGDTHSLVLLVDSLRVQGLLKTIDPSASQVNLDKLFKSSSNSKATLNGTPGKSEGDTVEKLLDGLRRIILGPNAIATSYSLAGKTWADLTFRSELEGNATQLEDDAGFKSLIKAGAKIEVAGESLAQVAKTDFAAFASLYAGSSVRIVLPSGTGAGIEAQLIEKWGSIGAAWLSDKGKANNDPSRVFSSQWYIDRAKYLGLLTERNALDIQDDEGIVGGNRYIEDLGSGNIVRTGIGAPVAINPVATVFGALNGNALSGIHPLPKAVVENIIFGGTADDVITGFLKDDHLYGGDGDDRIDGGAGDDYLEGNAGADVLNGGIGNNTLVGGGGADVYELSGLPGFDTIIDEDGAKSISVGGVVLRGASKRVDGTYRSKDGLLTYKKQFWVGGKVDLLVTFDGSLGTSNSVLTKTILIKDWSSASSGGSGDRSFGIVLDDTPSLPVTSSTSTGDFAKTESPGSPGTFEIGSDGRYVAGAPQADAPDLINGSSANDLMLGKGGNDGLSGGDGDDVLDGGSGDDVLIGGRGSNVLTGGEGNDFIVGGDLRFATGSGNFNDAFGSFAIINWKPTLGGPFGNDYTHFSDGFSWTVDRTSGARPSSTQNGAFNSWLVHDVARKDPVSGQMNRPGFRGG